MVPIFVRCGAPTACYQFLKKIFFFLIIFFKTDFLGILLFWTGNSAFLGRILPFCSMNSAFFKKNSVFFVKRQNFCLFLGTFGSPAGKKAEILPKKKAEILSFFA